MIGGALVLVSTLVAWPQPELERLAPLCAQADVAVVESNSDGSMKQVTVLAWIGAPAPLVREVIAQSERYREFVPNLTRSTREPAPGHDGQWRSRWRMELPVSSFEGVDTFWRDGDAVLVRGETDEAAYRYEALPVGGGTLLVQYGYTDVRHSNAFVRSFVRRQPMMEHGLALSAQLMFVSAMRREAVRRGGTAPSPPPPPGVPAPSFAPLLARGQVALMRSVDGALGDVSVVDRVFTGEDKILDVIARAGEYDKFVPGVDRSYRQKNGFFVEMALPIVTWATTFALRAAPHAVDGAGIEGDLAGARFRWDLAARGDRETMVVYRVRQKLDAGSVVLRKLFQFQPSLEYGINVALGLVWMRAVRGRAEGWATTAPTPR